MSGGEGSPVWLAGLLGAQGKSYSEGSVVCCDGFEVVVKGRIDEGFSEGEWELIDGVCFGSLRPPVLGEVRVYQNSGTRSIQQGKLGQARISWHWVGT